MAPAPPEGDTPRRAPRALREEEPFATMRAYPRRFGVGVPLVFAVAIGAGVLLAERSLSLGLAALLVIQTAGLLGLYVPALRRTLRRTPGEERPPRGEGEEG
jgi:hypothetical protein